MGNDLQIFKHANFGQIRWVNITGKEYAVGIDIARALGYSNPSKAVIQHCRGITKMGIPSGGGMQETNVIPEGDIYRLITHSELPSAEKFESWVFDEVLPTLRKTGQYQLMPKSYAEALRELAATIEEKERLEEQNKLMEPKVEFFDAVAGSKDAIAIGDAAKVLNMGIGPYKLFQFLRDKKILKQDNIPYQEFIDRGYFRTIEQKYNTPKGETRINIKTLVYQKGLDYIRKLIKENAYGARGNKS